MRDRLSNTPAWAQSLLAGGFYALLTALKRRFLDGDDWITALVGGAVFGLLFGAVVGPIVVRQQRRAREAVGADSAAQLRRAVRAASRGPVPDDPQLRETARRYALHQRGELLRQRRWAILSFAAVVALTVWLALRSDAVFALFAAGISLCAFGAYGVQPRRLARRAELLAEPPV